MAELPRVLIIDDEPGNIQALAQALEGAYALRFATHATDALRIAERFEPDLILLDVVMPERDGYALLADLQQLPALTDTPVIFVTARGEVSDEASGFAAGAVDYITKPFSPPLVRARVRLHLQLKQQRDLLAQRAQQDGLTGVANRRTLDEQLPRRWEHCRTAALPLGLFLIDIDHFKGYNDSAGHLAGDDCLRQVAMALDELAQSRGHLFGRYGGEEFLLIAEAPAAALGSDLLSCVQALAIPHLASSCGDIVSLSVGGLCLQPDATSRWQDALARSDELLYLAKKEGRNRCVYESPPAAPVTLCAPP